METIEYTLIFVGLLLYLTVALTFTQYLLEPYFDPSLLLNSFSKIALKPGSIIRISFFVPENVEILLKKDTIYFTGYTVSPTLIRTLKETDILKNYSDDRIILNLKFTNEITLSGGYVYSLRVSCIELRMLKIEILEERKVSD